MEQEIIDFVKAVFGKDVPLILVTEILSIATTLYEPYGLSNEQKSVIFPLYVLCRLSSPQLGYISPGGFVKSSTVAEFSETYDILLKDLRRGNDFCSQLGELDKLYAQKAGACKIIGMRL